MKKSGVLWRLTVCFVCFAFLFAFLSVDAFAVNEESGDMPSEYYGVIDELPSEVSDKLPDGIYSNKTEDIGEALLEVVSVEYIMGFAAELVGDGLGDAVALAAHICGIVILSAIFEAMRKNLSESVSGAVGFCVTSAIFAAIIDVTYRQVEMVCDFFIRLDSLILSMIPVMGAVYAMGGNVSTGVSSSSGMYAFLAVSEGICARTIAPVSSVCIAMALCRGISPSINLQGITSGIKKCYVFLIGMIMTVLLALLSSQTAISAAADSTAARAAKMVTSSAIPIVGGSVAETLRTVASGVQYTKSVVGVGGIVFLMILLLPTLISLLLTRLALIFSGSVAELLGCEGECRIIRELDGVWGLMIAVVAMCSVMFILVMTVFLKTAVAIL